MNAKQTNIFLGRQRFAHYIWASFFLALLSACGGGGGGSGAANPAPVVSTVTPPAGPEFFTNAAGVARSYSALGPIDTSAANPFFKNFGNGRNCASCHVQGQAFSLTPDEITARFNRTNGLDPLFLPHDGANAPNLPVATEAERRSAYSLLLSRGLLRIGQKVPTQTNDVPAQAAEFVLDSVSDPYGYANANDLSAFRRPLPSTNLRFLAAVMWDSRETARDLSATPDNSLCVQTGVAPLPCYKPFSQSLKNQANTATLGHAQAAVGLTAAEQQAVVDFELSLFSAQEFDNTAQFLTDAQAKGGAAELTTIPYYFDINSVFGDPRTGLPAATTKLTAMSLFSAWETNTGSGDPTVQAARAAIARGQRLFNTRTFTANNVAGLPSASVTGATCTNCHSTPQVGSMAQPNLINLGIGDPAISSLPELPTYTFRNVKSGSADFGRTVTVQDPGLAMHSGKWADMGKFKVPSLRALSMRAPYFHDGSARTLNDVVAFYVRRFRFDTPLSRQDVADLTAFLRSL